MRTFYEHKHNCPSLVNTSTSYYFLITLRFYPSRSYDMAQEHNTYLSSMNFRLLNEITDSETQKNYYKYKVTEQFHSHHSELEQAFNTISEKNNFIIQLEEQLDRMSKDYRILSDEYVGVKAQLDNEKELHEKQTKIIRQSYEKKIQQLEEDASVKMELKINKRLQEVEQECEKRVQMYKEQLDEARGNSTQLVHELKILREDYNQVMAKNDTIIQESIQRELRKRDFEAQNDYLKDVAQFQHAKKVNNELKTEIQIHIKEINSIKREMDRLKAENVVLQTKLHDVEEAFEHQKANNRVVLQEKFIETYQIQTNTEQPFVPVVLPVETNLVGEIIALKQFLVEKMIIKYEEFFTKASLKEKKKSASLITFKNYLAEELKNSQENFLLMHLHTGLERIIKLYCPAMSYSREFLTVKDEFIRKTLMQCEGLTNVILIQFQKEQKLFRLLELVNRLHHPITHLKSEISTGELKMVEIKIMSTLKKIFSYE